VVSVAVFGSLMCAGGAAAGLLPGWLLVAPLLFATGSDFRRLRDPYRRGRDTIS
jgi:hypothetical protein